MAAVDPGDTGLVIPEHVRAAHRRVWERIAGPGTWWSGAQRVGIAAEVRAARTCPLCRERKLALAPGAVAGAHATASDPGTLPPAAVAIK